jgi:hypothetical protein
MSLHCTVTFLFQWSYSVVRVMLTKFSNLFSFVACSWQPCLLWLRRLLGWNMLNCSMTAKIVPMFLCAGSSSPCRSDVASAVLFAVRCVHWLIPVYLVLMLWLSEIFRRQLDRLHTETRPRGVTSQQL